MDGIATHLEATVAVALETGRLWPGSGILELGCGDYSTPVLARIGKAQGRQMTNIVSDLNWAARFRHCFGNVLEIPFDEWPRVPFNGSWGMCLMDNEQDIADRFENAKRMAKADIGVIVVHDSAKAAAKGCRWRDMKAYFQHVVILGRRYPETPGTLEILEVALLSNKVNPAPWFHPGQIEVVR